MVPTHIQSTTSQTMILWIRHSISSAHVDTMATVRILRSVGMIQVGTPVFLGAWISLTHSLTWTLYADGWMSKFTLGSFAAALLCSLASCSLVLWLSVPCVTVHRLHLLHQYLFFPSMNLISLSPNLGGVRIAELPGFRAFFRPGMFLFDFPFDPEDPAIYLEGLPFRRGQSFLW